MRITALLWIVEGLLQWSVVMANPSASPIMTMAMPSPGIVAFFAVIDLIAAVGLWLATPWGGVIWLASVSAQILVALIVPDFYDYRGLIVVADVALISVYTVLTWRVSLGSAPPTA